jgi:hypothetical protein
LLLGLASAGAAAQDVPGPGAVRTAVRLSADTVLVGEPFTVGVIALASDTLRFPPLLDPGDNWEQLEVVRIEAGDGGERRAYYRLVAWESGRLQLPELALRLGAQSPRTLRLPLPAPFIQSVLPADARQVELRGPRPPRGEGFPWWVLLAALLALALAVWWWRRRRTDAGSAQEAEAQPPDAAERARAALVALRQRASSGELAAAEFYDRLEAILRTYLAETREWPPARPTRAASWLDRGAMRDLHRQAVVSRFAGVNAPDERLVADADLSLDWLSKDAA